MEEREIWEALCSRHSTAVQEKLWRAQVAVAGLGGLGSNIAVSLARIGVGHLHLLDFDEVDLTNLNRQYYFLRHIGMKKTEALKEILLDINPYLDIQTDCRKVKGEDIPRLFQKDKYICEAFDRAEQKAMLVNGIREYFPDKVLVAGNGMEKVMRYRHARWEKTFIFVETEFPSPCRVGGLWRLVLLFVQHIRQI